MKTFTVEEAGEQLGDLITMVDREESFTIVKDSKEYVILEKPWVAPPGYFNNCDTPEEIREQNMLAKHSVIRVPHDLE